MNEQEILDAIAAMEEAVASAGKDWEPVRAIAAKLAAARVAIAEELVEDARASKDEWQDFIPSYSWSSEDARDLLARIDEAMDEVSRRFHG